MDVREQALSKNNTTNYPGDEDRSTRLCPIGLAAVSSQTMKNSGPESVAAKSTNAVTERVNRRGQCGGGQANQQSKQSSKRPGAVALTATSPEQSVMLP